MCQPKKGADQEQYMIKAITHSGVVVHPVGKAKPVKTLPIDALFDNYTFPKQPLHPFDLACPKAKTRMGSLRRLEPLAICTFEAKCWLPKRADFQ